MGNSILSLFSLKMTRRENKNKNKKKNDRFYASMKLILILIATISTASKLNFPHVHVERINGSHNIYIISGFPPYNPQTVPKGIVTIAKTRA